MPSAVSASFRLAPYTAHGLRGIAAVEHREAASHRTLIVSLHDVSPLTPEGLLATFCCSHHVSHEHFREMINEATVDAKKTLRQLATYTQAPDHPIVPTLPETEYLKGYLFELAPGR